MKEGKFIISNDGGAFEIINPKTRETTGPLTFGELVEQIAALFEPSRGPYPMKTKREWGEQRARRRAQAKFKGENQ